MLSIPEEHCQALEERGYVPRRKVLLTLAAILLICNLPICVWWLFLQWRAPGVGRTIYELGVVLYVVLPLLAARWWPRTAGFQIKWLPVKKSDYFLSIFLLVLVLGWMGFAGWFIRWIGWSWWIPGFPEGRMGPMTKALRLLTTVLIVPIAEEFLYRGYVQGQLTKITKGYLAVILQAVLFALPHVPSHSSGSLVILGFGLMMGFWRLWKRSLLLLIVVHLLINALFVIPPYLTELELNKVAQSPPEVGIPAIGKYLDNEKQSIRLLAADALVRNYGKAGSRQYAEILEKGTDRQVETLLLVVEITRCVEVTPSVRKIVYDRPDMRLQMMAVLTLRFLRDTEGLKKIAQEHPTARIRTIAQSMLDHLADVRKK